MPGLVQRSFWWRWTIKQWAAPVGPSRANRTVQGAMTGWSAGLVSASSEGWRFSVGSGAWERHVIRTALVEFTAKRRKHIAVGLLNGFFELERGALRLVS
jgi:hypothetical protein